MNEEILPEIRNKMIAPKIAFEKLSKGEKVPKEFLELVLKELKTIIALLQEKTPFLMDNSCPNHFLRKIKKSELFLPLPLDKPILCAIFSFVD